MDGEASKTTRNRGCRSNTTYPIRCRGRGVDGTQQGCFETDPTSVGDGDEGRSTSMSCLIVLAFGVPLGWQTSRPFLVGCSFFWDRIALYPFLGRCSQPRHLGIVANRAFLIDVGIDRLHRSAISSIQDLPCRSN